jgi:transcriptional regulator with XRE-family HTH domain
MLGLSLEDMADACGCTRQNIRIWESGKVAIKASSWVKITDGIHAAIELALHEANVPSDSIAFRWAPLFADACVRNVTAKYPREQWALILGVLPEQLSRVPAIEENEAGDDLLLGGDVALHLEAAIRGESAMEMLKSFTPEALAILVNIRLAGLFDTACQQVIGEPEGLHVIQRSRGGKQAA